jgi:probable HAF family extracellular repeat protein
VVGTSDTQSQGKHAFLWTPGSGMVDLNTLIDRSSGWVLIQARGINDGGQIVGQGLRNGQQRAFRLTRR